MAGSSCTPDPWLNPFPTGKGWVAMLFGSARGDEDLFLDYMKIAMRYSSAQGLVDASEEVRKKATTEEKQRMDQRYATPGKGIMPIDMLLWAMKEADSGDAGQRQRWADHHYVAPAQSTAEANANKHQDKDDDLQIIAPPALQARRRPPPISFIDEDEDEEEQEVQMLPNHPTEVKQEVRRSGRLAGQVPNWN